MRSACPARSVTVLVALLAVLSGGLTLLSACTDQPAASRKPESAADVVSRLGKVPIPSDGPGIPAPVPASIGHPQLLAMGAPVDVTLPGGIRAVVTSSGPDERLPSGGVKPGSSVAGDVSITITPSAGTVRLIASDLSAADLTGKPIALHAVGPAEVTASPGHPATMTLGGVFPDGNARFDWRQDGHVLAIWDFTVEVD